MDAKNLLGNFNIPFAATGLEVFSPVDGGLICRLIEDDRAIVDEKIKQAATAQKSWNKFDLSARAELLNRFIAAVEGNKSSLGELITIDAGKTADEASGEVGNFVATFKDMISLALGKAEADSKQHQAYLDKTGNLRIKKTAALGIGGVITSYNFPLGVASWSLAPMLLTGNAAIWKPSEKTPLVALAVKDIFNKTAGTLSDLFQILIGGRETGEALVAHNSVGVISATGSVAMGDAIIKTLSNKPGNRAAPILELGGNNGIIISEKNSAEYLGHAADGIMHSFLAGGGQKCTNTRRAFVQDAVYDQFIQILSAKIEAFIKSGNVKSPLNGASSKYGYAPLIDKLAFDNYRATVQQALAEGGKLLFGQRVSADVSSAAYYLNPGIMLMPNQTDIMFKECFAPLLFVVSYNDFETAIEQVTAPENAGLVNGIYSQNLDEIERFEAINAARAGHTAENMPTGTGTPAHRLGFGGKRKSGSGVILDWEGDPFAPFTSTTETSRVVRNSKVPLDHGN